MCLIIFAYQADPLFPLVVAANRDELFARPTAQAGLWTDEESGNQILAGRDLQAEIYRRAGPGWALPVVGGSPL